MVRDHSYKINFFNDFLFNFLVDVIDMFSIKVSGQGIFVEILQDFIKLLHPLLKNFNVDFNVCLPNPIHPDFNGYAKIGFLTVLCWFLLILEPIGSRLQFKVMEMNYPERSLERTVWLYHYILRKRMSFIKLVMREARWNTTGDGVEEHMTCAEYFKAKLDR